MEIGDLFNAAAEGNLFLIHQVLSDYPVYLNAVDDVWEINITTLSQNIIIFFRMVIASFI